MTAAPEPFLDRAPCAAPVTQEFGDMFSGYPHRGRDYGCPVGTPIVACAPGVVVPCTNDGSFGLAVCIDYQNGLYGLYAHLSRVDVAFGQLVRAHTVIGMSGNTGVSTGPHCHQQLCVNSQFPVDITYSRDPRQFMFMEDEMSRIEELEKNMARANRLLGGNGVTIACYPGWGDLIGVRNDQGELIGFPEGTPFCELKDDNWSAVDKTPTYEIRGWVALEACDRRGFSFPLGLRSTQVALKDHVKHLEDNA